MNTIEHPITGEKIQVGLKDFSDYMEWAHAIKACSELGNGWRLPTKEELNQIYLNKNKIGGFQRENYLSSTECGGDVWTQDFANGRQEILGKGNVMAVRPVRAI